MTPEERHQHRARHFLRRFGHLAWNSNLTGLASMLAYTMLLGVVPIALLGLFVAGHVLSSPSVMHSVEGDLRDIFPGSTKHTLQSVLSEVSNSTTGTGILALVASIWLASSFWGALDVSFSRIYNCPSRPWLHQKRFGIVMVGIVLLFMFATVLIPTMQSLLKATAGDLPLDLAHVHDFVYVISLISSLAILFGCLAVIYHRVPTRDIPWRAVWPGTLAATVAIGAIDYGFPIYHRVPTRAIPWRAVWPGTLAATVAIGAIDYGFPVYLSSISTIARFGTTVVFIVIVLGWFYLVAIVILAGAVMNAAILG